MTTKAVSGNPRDRQVIYLFKASKLMKYFFVALMCFVCTACTPALPGISLTQAIQSVENELAKSHYPATSNVVAWSPEQTAMFVQSTKMLQCQAHTPDPIVPIMLSDVVLTLTGGYTTNMGFEVDAAATPTASILKLTDSKSTTRANTVQVPLTFASLDNVPDVVFKIQKDRLDGILDKPYAGSTMTELDHLIANRTALQTIIAELVKDYSDIGCLPYLKKPLTDVGAYMGTTAPKQKN